MSRGGGWHKESYRHSLAAKGVVTNRYMAKKSKGSTFFGNRQSTSVEKELTSSRRVDEIVRRKRVDESASERSARLIREGHGQGIVGRLSKKAEKVSNANEDARIVAKEQAKALRQSSRGSFLGDVRAGEFKNVGADIKGAFARSGKVKDSEVKITPKNRSDVLAAAKKAVDDANRGVLTSDEDKVMLQQFSTIPEAKRALQILSDAESAERREREGVIKGDIRSSFEKGLENVESAPGVAVDNLAYGAVSTAEGAASIESAGLKGIGEGRREFLDGSGGPGLNSKIEGLGKTSFIGVNTSIGNEEDGSLRPFSGPLPALSSGFDDALRVSEANRHGSNTLFNKKNLTFADGVDNQVAQLDQSKDKLAAVDMASFRAGTEAFESGDREGLISAISGLKREEDKIANRWSLVEQTKKNVTSVNNHQAVFADQGTDNIALQKGRGGDRIADQTEKLEGVFTAMKDSNDKLFARRRMLQFRLQRLDANVLPEQGAPDFDEIQRFSGDESKGLNAINVRDMIVKDNVGLELFK